MPRSRTTPSTDCRPKSLHALATPGVAPVLASMSRPQPPHDADSPEANPGGSGAGGAGFPPLS